jgi:hypothetical protein
MGAAVRNSKDFAIKVSGDEDSQSINLNGHKVTGGDVV